MTLLRFKVMLADFRPEVHRFDRGVLLMAARLAGFDAGVVLEFAVVNQLADRRIGLGRDLNQIKFQFLGRLQSHLPTDHADLFAVWPDKTDLVGADLVVDARLRSGNSAVALAGGTDRTGSFQE